jgi:hypothetical protein
MRDYRLTVTIQRPEGRSYRMLHKQLDAVVAALKPLGVRIRVGVAPSTMKQWQAMQDAKK